MDQITVQVLPVTSDEKRLIAYVCEFPPLDLGCKKLIVEDERFFFVLHFLLMESFYIVRTFQYYFRLSNL